MESMRRPGVWVGLMVTGAVGWRLCAGWKSRGEWGLTTAGGGGGMLLVAELGGGCEDAEAHGCAGEPA